MTSKSKSIFSFLDLLIEEMVVAALLEELHGSCIFSYCKTLIKVESNVKAKTIQFYSKMTVGAGITIADGNLVVFGSEILSDVHENVILTPVSSDSLLNGAFIGVNSDGCGSCQVFPIRAARWIGNSKVQDFETHIGILRFRTFDGLHLWDIRVNQGLIGPLGMAIKIF
ncbi:putative galactinol--sucrose galactosyltransferase 1 [Cinnamomum micranthum f. kanehirae]|uniref:Putative galactinol--sucrose galactosyltransferase 1 n=1 Tax=Cinnamomum micranthum f. kanehirae TaxID=337451 RepID=A0A3S3ME41_9MAGN|nr:putative galactinol--sucrose galactosyltransferase 1 [Cinnamomum micranthum f. kanehirae]